MPKPKSGLYRKFEVKRLVGEDKPGEEFFVLSPTHDSLARTVLYAYAVVCREAGLQELASDLEAALERVERGGQFYQ